ncbi:MAG: YgiQ family radical SAM protein [Prevotellaceae bacterium]|nr:YgiQ family radical SAM protein [Prevotellaceae bacterium]
MTDYQLSDWLPTTRKEMDIRGWEEADVILFSADAYVDHPSFGAAVIGRTLEAQGLRVAIVPQPDWHGDYRDFKKLGRPRLFFGIAPGCMDSMVNKYTANKRLRSEDAYSPDGRHDCRPEYPTIVYTKILKEIYPDVPVVLGGIEASMRRLTHYDYWQDRLRPSILVDSGADLLIYGMGEKPICELTRQMEEGRNISDITEIPQTAYLCDKKADMQYATDDIVLHSHEECLQNKKAQAENFRHIEEESNKIHANRIVQEVGRQVVVVNPPYPPMTTEELDRSYELPYTRLPHPKYKNKRIPAYEMIKFSVNIHRGCFGGCAFCTISAHQGKFISCRSKKSILEEVKKVSEMPGFKGYLSDLGGPSANMYGMEGKNKKACAACKRPSCINPQVCPNLNTDHSKLLEIYRAVDALPYIKKSFIGSGVRYDLLLHRSKDENVNKAAREYTRELIVNHVSGRLKVAPEHTCPAVLKLMRKPSFELFNEFKKVFEKINAEENLRQQIIPYFISSHPGCHEADMAELAVQTKKLDFHLEQVQDFTPTPMTVSTETWYTGYDPYTLEPVFSAHTPKEKLAQRMFFFWYKQEERRNIEYELKKIGRSDLISQLYGNKGFAPAYSANSRQDTTEHRTAGRRDASSRDFTGRRDGSGRDFAGRKRFSSTQEPTVKNKGKRYVPTDEAQNSRYAKDSNKGSRGRGRYKDNSSSKQRW